MSDGTSIEWTDASWNPLRARATIAGGGTGWACVRVSQGCVNCYAATINKRLGTGLDYTVPALAKVKTFVDEKALEAPVHWRKPRRIFVCSMTDLFGEWVTDQDIARVFGTMEDERRHTFQVLTKRPDRMRKWIRDYYEGAPPSENIWLGTSVEDQAAADARIPELLATPAAVRFLSCEPLLGPVDLSRWLIGGMSSQACPMCHGTGVTGFGGGAKRCPQLCRRSWADDIDPHLQWVIVGGESGPQARPMDLEWARSLVAQCRAAGITPFVKQLGAFPVDPPGVKWPLELRDRKGGAIEEWPEDLRIREFPK